MDARHNASATSKVRETMMSNLFNGSVSLETPLTMFPCPPVALMKLRETFLEKVPEQRGTKVIGGLGKHYDLETLTAGKPVHCELKVTSGKATPLEELMWRPWKDTVQFLQGQLKSKIGKRFLGDCGDAMMASWFQDVVKPFSASIPGCASITLAGYEKALFTIGMKGKQEEAAKNFILALRSDEDLQSELQTRWLTFESTWFSTHSMDHEALKEVVKEIIESKDVWLCISKTHANWIDGLKVVQLDFVGPKAKPRGGMSFHYLLTLQRGLESKQVPMELKFHWKNGGQAVQNLNFMIL